MKIDPADLDYKDTDDLLMGCIVPRPIAFVYCYVYRGRVYALRNGFDPERYASSVIHFYPLCRKYPTDPSLDERLAYSAVRS